MHQNRSKEKKGKYSLPHGPKYTPLQNGFENKGVNNLPCQNFLATSGRSSLTILRRFGGAESQMVDSAKMGPRDVSLMALFKMASVACGAQFGWALQFSLLTPYVEELGISHAWVGYISLCGPLTGIFVTPLAGYASDLCRSPWGRRRPFIVTGACLVVLAVLLIGFAADLGFLLGDTTTSKPRAIVVFVVGFWMLDIANNTLQGPARALLADFTGNDSSKARMAYAFYTLLTAVGNVLGYAAGSYDRWYKIFWFSRTAACGVSCANLKSAIFIDIVILGGTTIFSCVSANEVPLTSASNDDWSMTPLIGVDSPSLESGHDLLSGPCSADEGPDAWALIQGLKGSFRGLSRPTWLVLAVNGISWLAWYPFFLYDTDWMGKEVYKGEPSGAETTSAKLYEKGVRMGGIGLILNAIVSGLTSLGVESMCKRWGSSAVWGASNIGCGLCFIGMLAISFAAKRLTHPLSGLPPAGIVVAALAVFAVMGAPMAVGSAVPYALSSTLTHSSGGGQGLSMGVVILSVAIPEMTVSLYSGGWDELFGGGNSPTFCVAAATALLSGILAITLLKKSLKAIILD